MTHYDSWITFIWNELRPVGIAVKNGSEKLALVKDQQSKVTAWQKGA